MLSFRARSQRSTPQENGDTSPAGPLLGKTTGSCPAGSDAKATKQATERDELTNADTAEDRCALYHPPGRLTRAGPLTHGLGLAIRECQVKTDKANRDDTTVGADGQKTTGQSGTGSGHTIACVAFL